MTRQTAYAFFLRHAGWSYDPAKETSIEGRRRCARVLAEAEKEGTELGLVADWEPDDDPDASFLSQEDLESARFHVCIIRDAEGYVLASLGGIHEDVRREGFEDYMRVVRAELFVEALDPQGAWPIVGSGEGGRWTERAL